MATTTTITKLPQIAKAGGVKEEKEDVGLLKMRIKELEKEVKDYKSRLDDLRKAKNSVVIKKTTEYVQQGGVPAGKDRIPEKPPEPTVKPEYVQQLEKHIHDLETTNQSLEAELKETQGSSGETMEKMRKELKEAKDLVEALKIENELTRKTLALLTK